MFSFTARFGAQVKSGKIRHGLCRILKCAPGTEIKIYASIQKTEGGISTETLDAICESVRGVAFDHKGLIMDGRIIRDSEATYIARQMGFIDFQELQDFHYVIDIEPDHPGFHGFLVKWRLIDRI